jgi:ATP-binding cassette subfamily B (MDR/TAP) protein 1
MSNRLREQYLAAILVQDQAFFDRIGPGEIVTRASKDVDSVRVGLGERLGYLIWSTSTMIAVSLTS